MIHVRFGIAGRAWIEMSAGARQVAFAASHGVHVHAMHASRNTLQVIHDLHEGSVRDLIFVELDRPGNFSALDFRGRLLNDVLINRDTARGCSGRRRCAAAPTATALTATATASSTGGWRWRLRCNECGRRAEHEGDRDRL